MMLNVIVTCRGRLGHLQHTLPLFLAGADRVCVVDYSCPDRCGDWAEQTYGETGRLLVKRVPGRRLFNKSKASNAGARHLTSLALGGHGCFFDADTITTLPMWGWLREWADPSAFGVVEPRWCGRQLTGALVVHSRAFQRSGGYDEQMEGWGYEDVDMRLRLYLKLGMPFYEIPVALIGAIGHSEDRRTAHYRDPKWQSAPRNRRRMLANVRRWAGSSSANMHDPLVARLRLPSGPC